VAGRHGCHTAPGTLLDRCGRIRAIHATLITGEHPSVLLIGAPSHCSLTTSLCDLLGRDLAEGALSHPRERGYGRHGDDPPEVRADEADDQ
jgi:hypothetical protein